MRGARGIAAAALVAATLGLTLGCSVEPDRAARPSAQTATSAIIEPRAPRDPRPAAAPHPAARRRRHHARPWGRRPGPAGRPAAVLRRPDPPRRRQRRQPREHAVRRRSAAAGRRLLRRATGDADRAGAGRLRRDVAGQQPHRGLRRPRDAAVGTAAGGQRDRRLRRRARPGGREPARGRTASGCLLRLRRVQRHRRDPARHTHRARGAVGPDAAPHRPAAARRPRPRARRRTAPGAAGRRRGRAAALGHAVHPRRRAGADPGGPRAGARRRRPGRGWAPALGAGTGALPRRGDRPLAGQLRLRHGLHGADHGGGHPDRDLPRRPVGRRRAGALPDDARLRAPTGDRGRGPRDPRDVRRQPGRSSRGRFSFAGARARPAAAGRCGAAAPAPRRPAGRPPSGRRRTACCPAGPRAGRPGRTTSGRCCG